VPAVEIGIGGFEVIVFKIELADATESVGVLAATSQVPSPKLESADEISSGCRLCSYLVSVGIHGR